MSSKTWALLSLVIGAAVIWLMPAASHGENQSLKEAAQALRSATDQVGASVQQTVKHTKATVKKATSRTGAAVDKATKASQRATATDPQRQPPLHGSNDHGQGTVALVDVSPSDERPLGGNPDGSDAGPEEVVAGRSRGEKQGDGSFHGHITLLALFGNELAGVNSTPGQSNHGPLEALQVNVLDPLCNGSAQQVCLQVLRADSATTSSGSINDFAVARAQLGGQNGLRVGAAESQGAITEDPTCQTSGGVSRTANVQAQGNVVAAVANSSSTSKSCTGQAPVVTNTSQVINLGGTGVPIPAPGCANGTPDTVTGIPTLLPVICNADEIVGAAGVRDALDVFVLATANSALVRESTAASESKSTAPPEKGGPECSDKVDNDKDGKVDADDPGCHNDGNPSNPASYNPNDTSEADDGGATGGSGGGGKAQCADGRDNDGDGKVDAEDPGCHTDGNANNPSSVDRNDDDETDEKGGTAGQQGAGGKPECSDSTDNDGDGLVDSADPGCHSDGNAGNAGTYVASDDSEADAARTASAGALPFTGTDVVGLAIAGLLVLAGGLVLRRREDLLAK
jgi:LPXTG-motif cell wall-anchored protein